MNKILKKRFRPFSLKNYPSKLFDLFKIEELYFADRVWYWDDDAIVTCSREALKTKKAFKKLLNNFRPDTPLFIKEIFKWCATCSKHCRKASFRSVILSDYFQQTF